MDTQDPGSPEKAGTLVQLAANIVSAYVSNNSLRGSELPELIAQVHNALKIGLVKTKPRIMRGIDFAFGGIFGAFALKILAMPGR